MKAFVRENLWISVLFAFLMVLMLVRCGVTLGIPLYINQVSGSWLSMAVDLHNGLFYRPLVGSEGFGGTRFFPLVFSLQALLLHLIPDPLLAGRLLSLVSCLLLVLAFTMLLKHLELAAKTLLVVVVLLLLSTSFQIGLGSMRGDILPVAFNLLGLLLVLRTKACWRYGLLALVLFFLAFTCKVTSLQGVATAWLLLAGEGRWRVLAGQVAFFALLLLLFAGGMWLASAGRFYEIFRSCYSDPIGFAQLLQAPLLLCKQLLVEGNFLLMSLLPVALVSLVRRPVWAFPPLFFTVCLLSTLVLFLSHGITSNHFIDLAVATLVYLGWCWHNGRFQFPGRKAFLAVVLLGVAFVQLLLPVRVALSGYVPPYAEVVRQPVFVGKEKLLLEDATLQLALDGRPSYLLDAYMLRMAKGHREELAVEFKQQMEARVFDLVVLQADYRQHRWIYEDYLFGSPFPELMDRYYRFVGRYGRFCFYEPAEVDNKAPAFRGQTLEQNP